MERLKKIMQKDSFYMVLFICICVVAASGVWVSKNNLDISQKFNEQNDNQEEIKLNLDKAIPEKKLEAVKQEAPKQEVAKEEPKKEEVKQEPVKKEPEQAKKVEQPKDEQPKVAQNNNQQQVEQAQQAQTASIDISEQQNISMTTPVKGNISKGFAKDKLLYSKTLDQWTTHSGLDIQSGEGTAVLAAMDGVIKEIKKDDALGITITIDHGNGLQTKYGNLATDEMVKKGQSIKKGSAISKVGKGSGFSKLEKPHLHFEVIKNGKSVDPKQFVK